MFAAGELLFQSAAITAPAANAWNGLLAAERGGEKLARERQSQVKEFMVEEVAAQLSQSASMHQLAEACGVKERHQVQDPAADLCARRPTWHWRWTWLVVAYRSRRTTAELPGSKPPLRQWRSLTGASTHCSLFWHWRPSTADWMGLTTYCGARHCTLFSSSWVSRGRHRDRLCSTHRRICSWRPSSWRPRTKGSAVMLAAALKYAAAWFELHDWEVATYQLATFIRKSSETQIVLHQLPDASET